MCPGGGGDGPREQGDEPWYAVIGGYRPTAQDHKRNTALVRRLYKRWCGISRHAKTEALFVPQVDSGMGLMDAHTHWAVGVQREWICNLYQSLDHFGTSQEEYLRYIHKRWGGCPAVLTPPPIYLRCQHPPVDGTTTVGRPRGAPHVASGDV